MDWETGDSDGQGIVDIWEVAVIAEVLCNSAEPLHDIVTPIYEHNLAEAQANLATHNMAGYFDHLWAVAVTVEPESQDDIVEDYGGVYLLIPGNPLAAAGDATAMAS